MSFSLAILVSGFDSDLIEQGLKQMKKEFAIKCSLISSTLEDAFISLEQETTHQAKVQDE